MVHYIALYKLNKEVDLEKIDEMIRSSRSQLFHVQEVHNVRSGKRIGDDNPYPFFIATDFETLDKLEMFRRDPIRIRFEQEVIKPNTTACHEYIYETEPGKNTKYS
jgi:hypothetical protein